MFSYRSLLKQAWKISWEHKYLWFFGLFSSILSAGGGYRLLTQNFSANYNGDFWAGLTGLLDLKFFYQNISQGLAGMFKYDLIFALDNILGLVLTAIIVIFFIWLAIACQGGLISHVQKIINHKKKSLPELSIKDGLAVGHKNFWALFGLNILFKVLVNFAFLIITIPFLFIALADSGLLGSAYIILFLIFIPVVIALNLIIKYAMAYNVIEHNSFVVAIENSWRLFRKNWLISVEMLIALFVIDFLAGVTILLFLSIFILPLFIVGVTLTIPWLSILMIIIAIIIFAIAGSILTTFENASWIGLFVRLEEKGGIAKLERIFQKKKTRK
ncbi:MAG: hypothetical protein NTX66_04255 [Candidatus Falkowbacteria bacterium]|nr:hypothetical protein [Candidatus Falkowbacteria bacterium]